MYAEIRDFVGICRRQILSPKRKLPSCEAGSGKGFRMVCNKLCDF